MPAKRDLGRPLGPESVGKVMTSQEPHLEACKKIPSSAPSGIVGLHPKKGPSEIAKGGQGQGNSLAAVMGLLA